MRELTKAGIRFADKSAGGILVLAILIGIWGVLAFGAGPGWAVVYMILAYLGTWVMAAVLTLFGVAVYYTVTFIQRAFRGVMDWAYSS